MASTINADNGVVSGTSGLKSTADTSGVLALQSNGTTGLTLNTSLALGVGSSNSTGSSGQVLTSAGSAAAPTWATPTVTSPAGSTGQVQYNNAGAFGAISSGTSGQVLTSAGSGAAPTWATVASPGATSSYGFVFPGYYNAIAFNPSDITAGTYYSRPVGSLTTTLARSLGSPVWSSFYNSWFSIMLSTSGSTVGLFASPNGLDWTMIVSDLTAVGVTVTSGSLGGPYGNSGGAGFAIDETNGRFFIQYITSSSTDLAVMYSDPSSSNFASGWTGVALTTSATGSRGTMAYAKMATTAASGIVCFGSAGNQTNQIWTCSAGSTTFTSRISASTPNSSNQGNILIEPSGKMVVSLQSQPYAIYNTGGDITTGWVQNTATGASAVSGAVGDVGNGYMVSVVSATGIRYSTTGSGTWTAVTIASGSTLTAVRYTGSVWVAFTVDGSIYLSSDNTPITWTAATGAQATRRLTDSQTSFRYGSQRKY